MKSIIFNATGDWLQVLEEKESVINDPDKNEVQIKVMCRPINPSDEMFIQGVYRQKPSLPQIAGLEGAGVITKCGSQIDEALVNCSVIFRAKGTWADFINLPVNEIRLVPAEIPFQIACQLSLNTLTAFALIESAQLQEGDYLLLTAATSSVVQQIIQMAREKNIKTIAVIRNDLNLQRLRDLGADYIVNLEKIDILSFLRQHDIKGVQASLDAVGGALGTSLIEAAAPFSRIIIYGRLSPDKVSFRNDDIIYKNLTLSGFGIDAWKSSKTKKELDDIWQKIFSSIINGSLEVRHDKIFPLGEFAEAIQSFKAREGRILLN